MELKDGLGELRCAAETTVRHPHLRPPKIAYRVFGCGQAELPLQYGLA